MEGQIECIALWDTLFNMACSVIEEVTILCKRWITELEGWPKSN